MPHLLELTPFSGPMHFRMRVQKIQECESTGNFPFLMVVTGASSMVSGTGEAHALLYISLGRMLNTQEQKGQTLCRGYNIY